jgi:hypothetical protein
MPDPRPRQIYSTKAGVMIEAPLLVTDEQLAGVS